MVFVEQPEYRTAKAKIYRDNVTGERRAVLSAHDQHYWDAATWQNVAEAFENDGAEGFTQRVDKVRHTIRVMDDGSRRWYPRRNVPGEYVTIGPLEWNNAGTWQVLTLGSVSRAGNVLTWDQTNFTLRVTSTWRGVKIEIILKTSVAARPFRWPISLTGLTRNGFDLISSTDSTVVADVSPATAVAANGANLPISTSIAAGYVTFTGNQAAMDAAAYPVTIDPTFTSPQTSGDLVTYMRDDEATLDHSTQTIMRVGHFGTPQNDRGLLKFDLSSITGPVTVSSATLDLWVDAAYNAATHNLYRCKRAITETGTWNAYDGTNAWTTAGAGDTTNDREATSVGSATTTGAEGAGTQKTVTLTNSAVEEWINGTVTNNGLVMIASTEASNTLMDWRSDDNATAANRPLLTIVYTSGGGGPDTPELYGRPGGLSASRQLHQLLSI